MRRAIRGVGSKHVVLLAALLTFVIMGSVAAAQDPVEPNPPVPTLSPELHDLSPGPEAVAQTSEAMQDSIAAHQQDVADRSTPAAASERADSQEEYSSLNTADSKELLQTTFGPELDQVDNDPGRVVTDLDVNHYLGLNAAVVDQPGSHDAVVQSTIPMRNGMGTAAESLDLSLDQHGGHYESDFPLVATNYPTDLSQPIRFPDTGVTIDADPAGPTSTPTAHAVADSDLYYHEAATDTDILVSPLGQGAEIFAQLRSREAPETLSFDVSLPDGASMMR